MLDVTVGVNKGVVNKLDLSDVLVGTASVHQKYTDMLEAACLAIIKVGRAWHVCLEMPTDGCLRNHVHS